MIYKFPIENFFNKVAKDKTRVKYILRHNSDNLIVCKANIKKSDITNISFEMTNIWDLEEYTKRESKDLIVYVAAIPYETMAQFFNGKTRESVHGQKSTWHTMIKEKNTHYTTEFYIFIPHELRVLFQLSIEVFKEWHGTMLLRLSECYINHEFDKKDDESIYSIGYLCLCNLISEFTEDDFA